MSSQKSGWGKRFLRYVKVHSDSSRSSPTPSPDTTHSARSSKPLLPPSRQSFPSNPLAFPSITEPIKNAQLNREFLEKALQLLEPSQQITIRKYVVHVGDEAGTVLSRAHKAAIEKQRQCDEKQWTWTIHDRVVKLRDVADHVASWIDKFKAVGDIVANADPIHIGLPWAGIRFILEAVVSDSRQMTALLLGMKTALHMANRLRVYSEYCSLVPESSVRTNFEEVLAQYYACILDFLAHTIDDLEERTATHAFKSFVRLDNYDEFERSCNELAQRIEIDANNCDRAFRLQNHQLAEQSKKQLNRSLAELYDIKSSVRNLNAKLDLGRLAIAEDAAFDSYAEQHNPTCHQNTRIDLLRDIDGWIEQTDSKTIFWLNGMAGTGKSTISRTVATRYSTGRHNDVLGYLGASFFFKRGEGDRGSAKRFFTTLAAQLAYNVPSLHQLIADALDQDPEISRKSLRQQFEMILLGPLSKVDSSALKFYPLLLVIDALDECEDDDDIRSILRLLEQAKVPVRLRIFVTSRPELPIRLGFAAMPGSIYQNIVLHEIPAATIEHDITVFLKHEFAQIRATRAARQPQHPFNPEWPGQQNIQSLVKLAVPLFIFATTICRFVADKRGDPTVRLEKVLRQTSVLTSKLDQTYLPILNQLLANDSDEQDHEEEVDRFKKLLGLIVLLAEPLSVRAIAQLLGAVPESVAYQLDLFHSVLDVPKDENAPVRLLHLSFRDFLVQPDDGQKKKHPFVINEKETHRLLAIRCLDVLCESTGLKRDICSLGELGIRRAQVNPKIIARAIPAHLSYACQNWVHHVRESGEILQDEGRVHEFLQDHLLHWLEALSWIGRIYESVTQLRILRALVVNTPNKSVSVLVDDAMHFVQENRYTADLAPLQLYSSALIFAPHSSIIKQTFRQDLAVALDFWPRVFVHWNPESQKLQGHLGVVESVAFSADGSMIVSASRDRTLRLWTIATGAEIRIFEGHRDWIETVVFSPDGHFIASASRDCTVRLWETATGEEVDRIPAHDRVLAVSFSADGTSLIIVSDFGLIQRINVALGTRSQMNGLPGAPMDVKIIAGEGVMKFTGHRSWAEAAALSPDGQLLAMASNDGKVYLFKTTTGEVMLEFEGHGKELVNTVVFFPNGRLIASGSWKRSLRVWQTVTGKELMQVDGYGDEVKCAAYAPDGSLVALGSYDWSIQLQTITARNKHGDDDPEGNGAIEGNPEEGAEVYAPLITLDEGDAGGLTFSPDGRLLGAASFDGSAEIWNTTTGELARDVGAISANYLINPIFGPVSHVAISPDERIVLQMSKRSMQWIQLDTGECVHQVNLRINTFEPSIREDAETLYYGISQEPFASSKSNKHLQTEDFQVAAFSPDGRFCAARTGMWVLLWNVFTEEDPIHSFAVPLHKHIVWETQMTQEIVFSPDMQLIALATACGVCVWRISTEERLPLSSRTISPFHAVAFSQDARLIATTIFPSGILTPPDILLRKTATGDEVRSFHGHQGIVTALALSENCDCLASASTDNTVRLWNVQTGREIAIMRGHNRVAHEPDKDSIAEEVQRRKSRGLAIHDMTFARDGKSIQTNIGRIDLPDGLGSAISGEKPRMLWTGISGTWIQLYGQDVIWLPAKFRGRRVASHGNCVAVVQTWGTLSLFRFSTTPTPTSLVHAQPVKVARR